MQNKKKYLFNEAERLYIYEYMTINELADRLNVNRKTIMAWKESGDWDSKRRVYLKSKQTFHEEMYEFARKLMRDITADMESGERVDTGRLYAFLKMVPMFIKAKNYEDEGSDKENKPKPKGLTDDIVAEIEENILGIVPNDRNENNEEE